MEWVSKHFVRDDDVDRIDVGEPPTEASTPARRPKRRNPVVTDIADSGDDQEQERVLEGAVEPVRPLHSILTLILDL